MTGLNNQRLYWAFGVAVLVIVIDQLLKYWARTYIGFEYDAHVDVFSWFQLRCIENNGMAFGLSVGNKIFLTLFRVVAAFGMGYLVYYLDKKQYTTGFIIAFALILAGTIGNVIDCLFYGLIFDVDGKFGYGKVIDMLYFPIIKTRFPDWTPWPGQRFVFFSPVFNFADAAITTSVFYIILFKRKEFSKLLGDDEEKNEQNTDNSDKQTK